MVGVRPRSKVRDYKPKSTGGALGYFGAAWLDLFAAVYDAVPSQMTKEYARYLRVKAKLTRSYWYRQENPDQ